MNTPLVIVLPEHRFIGTHRCALGTFCIQSHVSRAYRHQSTRDGNFQASVSARISIKSNGTETAIFPFIGYQAENAGPFVGRYC